MQGFLRFAPALAVAALVGLTPPAGSPASSAASSDFSLVKSGLSRSVARDWLPPDEANGYAAIAYRAARAIPRLPGSRASNLAAVLRLVAAQRDRYTPPRARALFGMLDLNTRYLSRRPLPPTGTDVYDEDGVLYRSFPGYGLQFHPLGNFGRLTQLLVAERDDEGIRLAQALIDRAVPRAGTLTWEYYFPFGGGSPPWTSGMAQAVAAEALARAEMPWAGRQALQAIRKGLLVWPGGRPWVRLYRFSTLTVLNAQLQAAYSLEVYSRVAKDDDGAAFASQLRASALELLPRFDTGSWSLYALGGGEANLNYHTYVVSLLGRLARQTAEEPWESWQARFDGYLHEPPELDARRPVAAVKGRRPASITFWLSKQALVTLSVGGEARAIWLGRGVHTLTWDPGRRPAGAYSGSIAARDLAGNRTRIALLPVRVLKR